MSNNNNNTVIPPSQVWAKLERHAKEIRNLRLVELCRDADRVSSLVTVHNSHHHNNNNRSSSMLLVDLSRQHMSLETIHYLHQLAHARGLRKFRTQLAWGYGHNAPSRRIRPRQTAESPSPSRNHYRRGRVNIDDSNIINNISNGNADAPAAATVPPSHDGSMHMALRVPRGQGPMLTRDGTDALHMVHAEWDRLQKLSHAIRQGHVRGITGSLIRNVIVVGRGVAVQGLQYVYDALVCDAAADRGRRVQVGVGNVVGQNSSNSSSNSNGSSKTNVTATADSTARNLRRNLTDVAVSLISSGALPIRQMRFLTTIDPLAAAKLTTELDPAATLVISVALQGNEETGWATKALKSWLLYALGTPNRRADQILEQHMMLITGNDGIASVLNKPESVYVIPEFARAEAFTSFTAVSLLPLSIVFGWDIVEELLAGAHDMDLHFLESNPRRNLPVVLALTDIWNSIFLGASARTVTPMTHPMRKFPSFVGAIESQALGGRSSNSGTTSSSSRISGSSPGLLVVDGGSSAAQDRACFQGDRIVDCELVSVLDTQLNFNVKNIGTKNMEGVYDANDAMTAALFAHADSLAFGADSGSQFISPPASPMSASSAAAAHDASGSSCTGNRPSTLLIAGKLDAFTCGQLLALCEHRVAVKAHICEMDPFTQHLGVSVRMHRTNEIMSELFEMFKKQDDSAAEDEESTLHLSTRTILKHYAAMLQGKRSSTSAA